MQLYVSKTLSPRNWLEITGNGPFALVLTLYDTAIFSGVGTAETTAALDHPRGLLMVRTTLYLIAGLLLGLAIHMVVILTLPALASNNVYARVSALGVVNKTVLLPRRRTGRGQPAAARSRPCLCGVPARSAQRSG